MMLRWSISGSALFLCLAVAQAEEATSLSDLRNKIGGACPADLRRVTLIDANAKCNPQQSVTKSCDAKYQAPTKAWQACYEEVNECRRQVDEQNQTIYDYNDWIAKCAAADASRRAGAKSFAPGFAKVNSPYAGVDFAARLKKGQERNDQMEAVNGKQQQEFTAALERKRSDLEAARREEARIRQQLQIEREIERRAQLMRQLEQQEEQRAMMENIVGSFLQGFVQGFSGAVSSSPSTNPNYARPAPASPSGDATRETSRSSGQCAPFRMEGGKTGC
jgi:hypothetical protein